MRRVTLEILDEFDQETKAVVVRTVALDSAIVELDLSETSSAALDDLLAHVLRAGRPVDALHKAESLNEPSAQLGVREYNKLMRQWAADTGRESEIIKNKSNYRFSAELRHDFAVHLKQMGAK